MFLINNSQTHKHTTGICKQLRQKIFISILLKKVVFFNLAVKIPLLQSLALTTSCKAILKCHPGMSTSILTDGRLSISKPEFLGES